ncbi:MAG: type II secretion system protein [Lentisphaerae bacterium]|jgi:general secretion pathway protein F|nr:type II secretion system protein [Lentisphaerota bacterium]
MAQFNYTAKSRDGKNKAGIVDAADRRGAISAVERMGLIPLTITEKSGATKQKSKSGKTKSGKPRSAFKLTRPNHMTKNELSLFTGELCDLIDGGMTLGNALNRLGSRGDGESGPSQVITALRDSIVEGASFSAALEKFPKIFSPIYVNMIRAGEASGALTDVLRRLIEHQERSAAVRAKVTSAMVYPAIVLVMGFGVAIFAMTSILPKFKTIFDSMGPDGLPPMTKMLIGISDWIKKYGILLICFIVAAIIGLYKWIQTHKGRRKWDNLKLTLPLIKGIVASATYANFARTLQSLMENGVPVLQALKITSQTVGNSVVGDELLNARERVTDGTTISGPLAAGGVFPRTIIDLISIGEDTGDMPSALGHIAKRYENELNRNVEIFTSALEPIMIFAVALIIGFIAVSVMQAVLSVTSGANIK